MTSLDVGTRSAIPERLGVVVVNYGAHSLIERNFHHVGSLADVRVIIVDNFHSTRERVAIAEVAERRGWTLLPMADNSGFGRGVNVGVSAAWRMACGACVLVNPDVEVEGTVLMALRDACATAPMTMFSPRVVRPDGGLWFGGGQILPEKGRTSTREDLEQSGPNRWLTGACLAVSPALWNAVQGFDDSYFLYWEDIDLSTRCLNAGGELRVRHDLTVVHSVGGTQLADVGREKQAKSKAYYRYNCRNRLLYAAKHLSRTDCLKWAVRTPQYAWTVLRRGGRRQFRRPVGILWAAAQGSCAGLWVLATGGIRHKRQVAPVPDAGLASMPRGAS